VFIVPQENFSIILGNKLKILLRVTHGSQPISFVTLQLLQQGKHSQIFSEFIRHFECCTMRDIVSHWTLYIYVTVLCESLSLLIAFVIFGVHSLFY
jgi:hypothetical protein